MSIEFAAAIEGSLAPDQPFVVTDVIPFIRGGNVYKLSVTNYTLSDASNAVLPDSLNNLGLGTSNSPAFNGLAIGGAVQGTNKISVVGNTGILEYFLQYPSNTTQATYQNIRLDRHSSYAGGSASVVHSVWALTTTSPNGSFYEWPITSRMTNHTLGTTGAQNVAVNGTANKQAFSLVVNISNASPAVISQTDYVRVTTNNTIKFTTTGTLPSPLVVGTIYHVLSTGLTVSSFRISASQGGAAINTTTAGSGVHTFTIQGEIGPTWGGNFAANDLTGTVDPLYSCIGVEVNSYLIAGAGTDANRQRVGMQVTTGAGGQAGDHVGYGILFTPTASTTMDRAIHLSNAGGDFGIGLDLSEAGTFGTAGILGGAGTAFAWKNSSAVYNGTTSGARLLVGNDDNLYLDNFSNTTTNFRGANGAARLALTSTTMTSPLALSIGTTPNFTVSTAGTTVVAKTATGNVTYVPDDGQNRYAMNASGNLDIKFNAGGSLRFLGDATTILTLTGGGGLQIGAPTGGNKGVGTLNPSGAIYDNGTAPTGTAASGYVRATAPTITSPVLVTPNLGVATATSITGLSAPSAGSDAVNKTYADGIAAGSTWHASAACATTANLNVTAAGTGVGHTLTNNGALEALVLDGYTVVNGDRVLVKDQTAQDDNGIYTQTTLGTGAIAWVLTRATDFDAATAAEVAQGATLIVINGTAYPGNINSQWVETGPGPFTVDTTSIVFNRTSAPASGTVNSGTVNQLGYYAGTGTAVSGLTTANSGVLVTSSGGVPSISSTLPSALAIPSPTFSGTVAGSSTIPNSILVNSSLTIGTTSIALGATSLTLAGITSYNKITITAPATGSTLTIVDGKTFTVNKTLTLEGTDGTILTLPTSNKTLMASDYSNGTTLTANALLTGGGAGTVPNAVALTGIVKGNGASAPTAVAAPVGEIVGTTDTQTLSAKTLTGTATNDSAPAGAVGEFLSATGTAVAVTSNTQTNIASLVLTPGDWDVSANIKFNPAATTTSTVRAGGLSLTSGTLPVSISVSESLARETGAITAGQGGWTAAIATIRVSTAGTPTIYCVGRFTFATSTATADCVIRARRVR